LFLYLQEKITVLSTIPATSKEVLGSFTTSFRLPEAELKKVNQLKDMLDKMLQLDPAKRITINQCLTHPFITDKL